MKPSWMRGMLVVLMLVMPVFVWFLSIGTDPFDSLSYEALPGQRLYLFSKLLGLIAIALIWLQVMIMLLRHQQWLKKLYVRNYHRGLGYGIGAASLLHATFFYIAVWIRKDEIPWDLLVPVFGDGYYKSMMSVGVVSLVLMGVGIYHGRKAMGNYRPIQAHRVVFVLLALVFVHSLAIGTESRMPLQLELYLLWIGALIMAVVARLRFIFSSHAVAAKEAEAL